MEIDQRDVISGPGPLPQMFLAFALKYCILTLLYTTLQLREEVERRPNAQQFEMKTTVVYISRRSGGGA